MSELRFQPFSDRLSRDIRNDLSKSFVEVIRANSMESAETTAQEYLKKKPAPCYVHYIKDRLLRYTRVLSKLSEDKSDPLFRGLLLWDEKLFFEVHEVLEHAWMASQGEEKLFLQAMIRAAGVYIKRDAGYRSSAEKISAKAIPVLERNRKRLGQYINPEKLLFSLKNLDKSPPRLLALQQE